MCLGTPDSTSALPSGAILNNTPTDSIQLRKTWHRITNRTLIHNKRAATRRQRVAFSDPSRDLQGVRHRHFAALCTCRWVTPKVLSRSESFHRVFCLGPLPSNSCKVPDRSRFYTEIPHPRSLLVLDKLGQLVT